MKTLKTVALSGAFLSAGLASYSATSTWNDGGEDASWNNSANWTGGVPGTSSDVVIGVTPTANLITVDTGVPNNTIGTLSFSSGIGLTEFVPGLSETLSVTGAISNLGVTQHKFSVAVTALGSATWTGPLLFANNVNIDTNTITGSGALMFTGSNINFSITNLATYGKFIGSFTSSFTGTINIGGTYTGTLGESFDFTTGNFSGATLGTLPTLSGGLVWNTSNFLSQGILTVSAVPEPATYAVLFGVAVLGFGAVRRRRKA